MDAAACLCCVDVAESVARALPQASSRFSFLCALGSREIRDKILLNEYTYQDASFSIGKKGEGSTECEGREGRDERGLVQPPQRLLAVAGSIDVFGNAFRLRSLDRHVFRRLKSLSLTNVHVSEGDACSLAALHLSKLSIRDSQLDVSIHRILSFCEISVRFLVLESVLCCCGGWGLAGGHGVFGARPEWTRVGGTHPPGPCLHAMSNLEYLGLLGNVRCARRACCCCITGDGVRRVDLAKPDDSVVDVRGLRSLEVFHGFWRKSWMTSAVHVGDMAGAVDGSEDVANDVRVETGFVETGFVASRPSEGCLRELDVEGDIDAEDFLAALVESSSTLRRVKIGGEVQGMTNALCKRLVEMTARGTHVELA